VLVRCRCCESAFATCLSSIYPDGEWFFTAILSAFGPLGTLAGAALDGGMMSAAINAGVQLATTGQVNWTSVGNSFTSGALSAGLSFGVGEMGSALGMGKDLAFTTIAHGISGGIQSAAFGGNFWSGVAGGVAGNLGGSVMGNDLVGRLGVGALAGGAASWAAGGDFWQGAQAGAYNGAFNYGMHEFQASVSSLFRGHLANVEAIKNREKLNTGVPQTEEDAIVAGYQKLPIKESLLHKIGGPSAWANVKYVDSLGYKEAVYNNGRLVCGINGGTYNVVPHSQSALGHAVYDVIPFFVGY
jgi:hypothetical protein